MAQVSEPKQAPPISFDADNPTLLKEVIGYYHATLKASPEALDYLKARGIDHPEAIDRFRLGYANRTLGLALPSKQLKAGAEIRGRLERLGLYRDSGHEHLNGSLVVPILDTAGNVVQAYGRKLLNNLRQGTPLHLYLPGPLKGVWNVEALQDAKEIILAKSPIDALTFWCAGHRHVTAAFGVEGFTEDHLEAFQRHGTQRVFIAFDGDEPGDAAALAVAQKLTGQGTACYRIRFPKGMDANAYALKHQPASNSLGLLIAGAERMGAGAMPAKAGKPAAILVKAETPKPIAIQPTAQKPIVHPQAMPKALPPPEPNPQPLPADDIPTEIQGKDLLLTLGSKTYRVRGWEKTMNPEILKINLMVSRGPYFYVDTLDMFQGKARTAFIRQASLELGEGEDGLKRDLGKVLRIVEQVQAEQLTKALAPKDQRPTMTEAEEAEALELLKSPNLTDRILQDFEEIGCVGEVSNKLTGYIAGVSRLLDRPLALLVQSASAAGKTSLIDSVLELMPPEDVVKYTAMSSQSLFYLGNRNLKHKILSIAEEEGARDAAYALKLLQSEGKITMASTGKDPLTGKWSAGDYEVEGPVSLFLTTTNVEVHEELQNRSIVLTVDESRAQTRSIHAVQRSRETLEGLLAQSKRQRLIALHRNAQRLLEPLVVVNPYADQLTFQDHQTRSRRDQTKYLTLIRSIALLHQFQRGVKTLEEEGRMVRYIEVIPKDIELANQLSQIVLGQSTDELQPPTRELLKKLHLWVKERCRAGNVLQREFLFTRREAREGLGCGDTYLKVHLARLVDMEYLIPNSKGHKQPLAYELLYHGEDESGRAQTLGLIDVRQLQPVGTTVCGPGREPIRSSCGQASVALPSRVGQSVISTGKASTGGHLEKFSEFGFEKSHLGVSESAPSQVVEVVR